MTAPVTVTTHHAFGPSSFKRRELCPASYRLEKDLPSFDTESSVEGTNLHAEVAAMIEEARSKGYDEVISGKNENAVKAYDKFSEILAECGREAFDIETRKMFNIEYFTERPLSYSLYGELKYTGTADIVIVCKDKVVIIDYKFGHRPVDDANSNSQGALYALAAMKEFGKDKADVHFFNPVIGQYTKATLTDKLVIAEYVERVINACKQDDAPIIPGEEQCRYCKAAHHGSCPALMNTAEVIIQKDPLTIIKNLSDDKIDKLYRMLNVTLSTIAEGVKEELKSRCEKNGQCGTWKLKEISGGKEITDINGAFNASGLPAGIFMQACSCSVTKLEKEYIAFSDGKFKTQKEAKADLAEKLTDFISMKPSKKTLVEVKA